MDDETLNFLIADEIEAVNGYNKAIKIFADNQVIASKLIEIRDEELEHIRELKELYNNLEFKGEFENGK